MFSFLKRPRRKEVLHAGFHKCLTVYYKRIMDGLAEEHGIRRIKVRRQDLSRENLERLKQDHSGNLKVFHVDDVTEDIRQEFFSGLRGSHFIRDPRDLVISAAYYHQVCGEKWCQFKLDYILPNPVVDTLVSEHSLLEPNEEDTYQTYISRHNPEQAFIIEMFRMNHVFEAMKNWNYDNPDFIEFRYEEIIGNESETFKKLFRHYGLPRSWVKSGVKLAEEFSLGNRKGKIKHVRSGRVSQWEKEFSPAMKELFKEKQGQLLIDLGYESGFNW